MVVPMRVARTAIATLLVACALVFAGLAHQVWDNGVVAFDQPVMMWLHSVSTPWLTDAARAVTHLGGRIVLMVAVALAAALCVLRRWGGALLVSAAVVGSSRINVTLKPVFERARPDFWDHMTIENTYSFPSGHTMAAMSIAAPLVVLAWNTRYRWPTLTVAVVYAIVVGVTRVYLGVHYPSDVLAGWCLTVLWVAIVVVALRFLAHWLRRLRRHLAEHAAPQQGRSRRRGRCSSCAPASPAGSPH